MFSGMNMAGSSSSLGSALFLLLLGPIVWAIHLSVIYVAHAVLCARGVAPHASEIVIAVATLAALIVIAGHLLLTRSRVRRSGDTDIRRFQQRTGAVLSALSMVGILWAAAAPIFVQACVAIR
jgi:hypothetical protein